MAGTNYIKFLKIDYHREERLMNKTSFIISTVVRGASYIILTPWSRVLLHKLTFVQLVKLIPVFYANHRFTAVFTRARHWSLS
jgi:hypothetical protein